MTVPSSIHLGFRSVKTRQLSRKVGTSPIRSTLKDSGFASKLRL